MMAINQHTTCKACLGNNGDYDIDEMGVCKGCRDILKPPMPTGVMCDSGHILSIGWFYSGGMWRNICPDCGQLLSV
jgi:hypothetical protein